MKALVKSNARYRKAPGLPLLRLVCVNTLRCIVPIPLKGVGAVDGNRRLALLAIACLL